MSTRRTCHRASRAAFGPALLALATLVACSSDTKQTPDGDREQPAGGDRVAKMELSSTAFEPGRPMPKKHTFDGNDVSPPLSWSGLPEGTKELALICDDPDAPDPDNPADEPWVHWVIYKIPADAGGLPEAVAKDERLEEPAGAIQGVNSWSPDDIGYRGPKPPVGTHRYFFKLYALDAELAVEPGLDKKTLLEAMEDHVLAQGQLMGTYKR